ncbi:uncharacterized protein LOC129581824 [Paramacrobiotus metropolitanus]|uniref:uncharacterized protein LOC129581824 n=1 Tax=Paramacrobiotus metropolitanus TaxID=2943436 RepID=UPI0024459757|nr:uncharacterized protein LOC129581824 [Paramacrobiotus metropolitanus]XP_055329055.1 uncharacterized protein LOC129581824 [Paramacrobiotus metropolitanus]XP_055329056.1 uncharacterized protein LOC129581824 [Paramacrobiotus metropolitanus]
MSNDFGNVSQGTSCIPELFVEELLRTASRNTEAKLSVASVQKASVRILDLFVQLAAEPHSKDKLSELLENTSGRGDVVLSAVAKDAAERLRYLQKTCQEIFREPNLSTENICSFLEEKKETITKKEAHLAEVITKHDQMVQGNIYLVQSTAKSLAETAGKNQLDQARDSGDEAFSATLEMCQKLETSQLQRAKWTLMEKFYTPEKITELRLVYEELMRMKTDLEGDIDATLAKKEEYESLGAEFRQLAVRYGKILRDIEVKERMLSQTLSP